VAVELNVGHELVVSEARHSEFRNGGAEADPLGAGCDRGECHVAGGHGELPCVMLADPEEVHARLPTA